MFGESPRAHVFVRGWYQPRMPRQGFYLNNFVSVGGHLELDHPRQTLRLGFWGIRGALKIRNGGQSLSRILRNARPNDKRTSYKQEQSESHTVLVTQRSIELPSRTSDSRLGPDKSGNRPSSYQNPLVRFARLPGPIATLGRNFRFADQPAFSAHF